LLTRSADGIEALLGHFEQLGDRLAASDEPWVITHGEPHAGDVLVDSAGDLHLIDWDDTRIAPRERDLRVLLHGHHHAPIGWDNDDVVAAYT
jgi:spectinomycin phosphotransferase